MHTKIAAVDRTHSKSRLKEESVDHIAAPVEGRSSIRVVARIRYVARNGLLRMLLQQNNVALRYVVGVTKLLAVGSEPRS